MMMPFSRDEGWGEGMLRMVIDDGMWFRLEKLLPKPKGRHGKDDRLFMMFELMNIVIFFG
ncbi:hypothetical protein OQJ05_02330 [Fluoribacter gormanii]|uniref:hypothetical protein n=1 Tax=Fluoribacter gormanii TaxID=464 RepID=UPI0010416C7C|nr:hypothetical protein [Fluoribacter gormanii]MCW8442887.1 hypothetical protein [Fluoribacter gormanii]